MDYKLETKVRSMKCCLFAGRTAEHRLIIFMPVLGRILADSADSAYDLA